MAQEKSQRRMQDLMAGKKIDVKAVDGVLPENKVNTYLFTKESLIPFAALLFIVKFFVSFNHSVKLDSSVLNYIFSFPTFSRI